MVTRPGSRGLRVLTPVECLAHLSVAEEPVVEEHQGEDVDLLDPKGKALEKLTAETWQGTPRLLGRTRL
jgi:hypothetical protein